MTLGIGNHIAKLKQTYEQEVAGGPYITKTVQPPQIVEYESYHEFEVLKIDGNQGDPEGFTATLKLVR